MENNILYEHQSKEIWNNHIIIKMYFKTKSITKNKEDHVIIREKTIYQEAKIS